MRSFLISAVAAATVLAGTAVSLSTDANAAARYRHHRVYLGPFVRHYPYGAFDAYGAYGAFAGPNFNVPSGRRDVNPISGTPRWNAAGGAS
jgi:hypothetical protein